MTDDRTAVVTGANRGIGLAVVQQLLDRGFVTVLACRDTGRGEAAAATTTPTRTRPAPTSAWSGRPSRSTRSER